MGAKERRRTRGLHTELHCKMSVADAAAAIALTNILSHWKSIDYEFRNYFEKVNRFKTNGLTWIFKLSVRWQHNQSTIDLILFRECFKTVLWYFLPYFFRFVRSLPLSFSHVRSICILHLWKTRHVIHVCIYAYYVVKMKMKRGAKLLNWLILGRILLVACIRTKHEMRLFEIFFAFSHFHCYFFYRPPQLKPPMYLHKQRTPIKLRMPSQKAESLWNETDRIVWNGINHCNAPNERHFNLIVCSFYLSIDIHSCSLHS